MNLIISYYLNYYYHTEAAAAQAIGVELSIISNFILNDSFTFKHLATSMSGRNRNKLYRLLKYNVLSLGTAGLNILVFSIFYYVLGFNRGLWYVTSESIAILAAFALNYLGSSRWAWKANQTRISKIQTPQHQ